MNKVPPYLDSPLYYKKFFPEIPELNLSPVFTDLRIFLSQVSPEEPEMDLY